MTIHGTAFVPRRASSGISTSSPGAPPVEDRDGGDDGDACYGQIAMPLDTELG